MFVKKMFHDSNKRKVFFCSICIKYMYYEETDIFRQNYLSFLVYTTRIGVILIWFLLFHYENLTSLEKYVENSDARVVSIEVDLFIPALN